MILFGREPGPLAQAGIATGLWPSMESEITANRERIQRTIDVLRNPVSESANGAFHPSLGQRPRKQIEKQIEGQRPVLSLANASAAKTRGAFLSSYCQAGLSWIGPNPSNS